MTALTWIAEGIALVMLFGVLILWSIIGHALT